MIVNGLALLADPPIVDMIRTKEKAHGTSWGLTECGYDIRIKQDVWFWPAVYDHENSRPKWFRPPAYAVGTPELRMVGNMALASSIEQFTMPNDLMGRVLNKSTWARQGLDASMTTNIEPGWEGWLTLELVYHGHTPLHIPAGSGIAQVIFERISCPAQYVGKYANQADMPVPAIMEL